jgi:methyl-accepting chemotaxis protein
VLGLLALAVYVLAGHTVSLSVEIARLIELTERVASGELVTDVQHASGASERHESTRLWASILRMNEGLSAIVKQARSSAEAIAGGARTIAEANAQLSDRTQEQAASLEETSSGMQQLASSARQNADHCGRASRLATASCEVAGEAAHRMQDAAATMHEIDDRTRRVNEILAAVEGIAFQTNILALNAAIEAAQAGHQGRGFAVVAGEVRNLAQRSAEAAREMKALVNASTSSVEKGGVLVAAAEATMKEVAASVQEVMTVIDAIARASHEQSAGVEEISRAIAQVDEATQQNAALVEESAGTTGAFEHEARQLVDVVSRFKTDRSDERGQVVALVKAAARHLREYGLQRACADFNDRNGPFVRGEQYVVVLDAKCTRLAFAPDPSQVGRDDSQLRDADGRYFSRDMVALAQANGAAWHDYRMTNPRTGRVEPKSMYIEQVGELVLGCGIYRSDASDALAGVKPATLLPALRAGGSRARQPSRTSSWVEIH